MGKKDFFKSLVGYSVPSYIGAAISLFSIPILTRLFTTEEMGKINMFIAYSNILLVFCNMGYEQAFVRFCNEDKSHNSIGSWASLCMGTSLIFTTFVVFGTLIFFKELSLAIYGDISIWCVIAIDLFLLARVITQYTTLISRMSQNVIEYSIQTIIITITTKIIFIVAAFWDPTFVIAVKIMVYSNLLLAIAFLLYFKSKNLFAVFVGVDKHLIGKLTKYSLPFVPTFFISTANLYLSQLILRKYVGFEAVGIYANAVSVANVLSIVQSGFNAYWPAFVFANYKTEQKNIQHIHKFVVWAITFFAMLAIAGQDILYIFVGNNFRESQLIFPLLIIVPAIYTFAETTRIGIRIAQKTYYELLVSVCSVGINVLLCFILIPKYSIIGAALSTVFSSIIGVYSASIISNKYYQSVQSFIPMTLAILILFIMACLNLIALGNSKYYYYILLFLALFFTFKNQVIQIFHYGYVQIRGSK